LTTRVGARAMLAGMITGIAVLLWVWGWTPLAFTWYAFLGAVVTGGVALAASLAMPSDG
jgi:solute:Na+ symporter, SSS family